MQIKTTVRTSLVVQQVKYSSANTGDAWVRSLVREDPTCCRATKPVHHSYWACALEPRSCNQRCHREKPVHHSGEQSRLTATRAWPARQQRSSTAKNKEMKLFYRKERKEKRVSLFHSHQLENLESHMVKGWCWVSAVTSAGAMKGTLIFSLFLSFLASS